MDRPRPLEPDYIIEDRDPRKPIGPEGTAVSAADYSGKCPFWVNVCFWGWAITTAALYGYWAIITIKGAVQ